MAQKLNPKITYVKGASELPIASINTEGNVLLEESGTLKRIPTQVIKSMVQGTKGFLKIADAAPTAVGKYELIEIGTYANLTPSSSPIITESGFYNAVYWDGATFTQIKTELPSNTAFIESFDESIFPLAGEIQRTHDGKTWQLKDGESSDSDDVPGISDKWELLSIGAVENAEIKKLKLYGIQPLFSTSDIAWAYLDKNKRASWLSVSADGGMPDFVKEYIADIYDKITKSRKDRITASGDSITEGGSPGNPYPEYLEDLMSDNTIVRNIGMSGKMSTPIAIRFGGVVLSNSAPVTIPASGSVTFNYSRNVFTGNINDFTYTGTFNGIAGSFAVENNPSTSLTFTRATAGTSSTVPAGTPIITDNVDFLNDTVIFWMGQNDLAWGYPHTTTAPTESVKACVAAMKPNIKRFLVVSVTNGSMGYKVDSTAQNDLLRSTFPDNFVDMQDIFITKGLKMAGITPTTEDLTAISNGLVPPSLLYDGVHPNDDCKRLVEAPSILEALALRGWV